MSTLSYIKVHILWYGMSIFLTSSPKKRRKNYILPLKLYLLLHLPSSKLYSILHLPLYTMKMHTLLWVQAPTTSGFLVGSTPQPGVDQVERFPRGKYASTSYM